MTDSPIHSVHALLPRLRPHSSIPLYLHFCVVINDRYLKSTGDSIRGCSKDGGSGKVDRRSPDERCMASFPSRLKELEVGWRLDALDRQGSWYPATVVEVSYQRICAFNVTSEPTNHSAWSTNQRSNSRRSLFVAHLRGFFLFI